MLHHSASIRLLNLGLTESWRTQAVYHVVAEMMDEGSPDTIIVCRPQTPYLCLGYHQIFDATFDRTECERRGFPVYRRRLGGGATYLDANQLFYQCVFHHTRLPALQEDVYKRLLAAPVATLRRLELDTELRNPNEIEVNNQRIAGVGGGRIGEAAVVVGNILFDFDYDTMSRVWRVPSETFRELGRQALQDHVTTLRQLKSNTSMETVQTILVEEFAQTLGRQLEAGNLTPAEENRARELAKQMTSEAYLNLHRENGQVAPMDSLKISAGVFIRAKEVMINGRTIRASFLVWDDHIVTARLESIPPQNWHKHEMAMRGTPFEEWEKFLPQFLRVAAAIQLSDFNINRI